MTFSQVQDYVAAFPEYVCFVPDELLGQLVRHLPPAEGQFVAGELLFRLWLYRGECPEAITQGLLQLSPEIVSFVRGRVLPVRANAREEGVFCERRNELELAKKKPCGAENFFTKRVRIFRRAAGVIPVVGGDQKNAFPIPFELQSDSHSERSVTDAWGNGIKIWEEGVRSLWTVVGKHRVLIPMDLGHAGADLQLTGGSLALPVGIAVKQHFESGHDPLLVLATGAVVDGRLRRVAGVEAKEVLARKMGVRLWFVPGQEGEDGFGGELRRVSLPEETLEQVLERVHSQLQIEGLAKLDVPRALRLLSRLRCQSATGRYPVEFLIKRAERCLEVFTENNHPILQGDAIPETQILLAALENHAGRAGRAAEILEAVGKSMANDQRIGLKLIPHKVVSFSDMGRFDDAEMWGRKALEWSLTLPEDRVGLEARIQASGSLGGDALLQKALRQNCAKLAEQSIELLKQNLEWAERLSLYCSPAEHRDDRNWAAMSASRVALWHAFFEPEKIVEKVAEAGDRIRLALGHAPPMDSSHDYLRRTALLGGFRALLRGFHVSLGDWKLPSHEAPCWVKATALKYRAALYASRDDASSALRDFEDAYALLRLDRNPVIQVIAWSIAAQAVISLPEKEDADFQTHLREDRQCVVNYLAGFGPSRRLCEVFQNGYWKTDDLIEFQMGFAY